MNLNVNNICFSTNIQQVMTDVHLSDCNTVLIANSIGPNLLTMNVVRLLLLAVCLFPGYAVFSQEGGSDIGYIRIRLNDLTTASQEQIIDDFVRSKPGILMSRTDHNTDVFFAHYLVSSGVTEGDFITWIQSVGFMTGCVVTGLRNGEPLKDFAKECGSPDKASQEISK